VLASWIYTPRGVAICGRRWDGSRQQTDATMTVESAAFSVRGQSIAQRRDSPEGGSAISSAKSSSTTGPAVGGDSCSVPYTLHPPTRDFSKMAKGSGWTRALRMVTSLPLQFHGYDCSASGICIGMAAGGEAMLMRIICEVRSGIMKVMSVDYGGFLG
jgi:hypothetical protein